MVEQGVLMMRAISLGLLYRLSNSLCTELLKELTIHKHRINQMIICYLIFIFRCKTGKRRYIMHTCLDQCSKQPHSYIGDTKIRLQRAIKYFTKLKPFMNS